MKFAVATILTAFFSFLAGLYFPWWFIAVVAFFVAMGVNQSPVRSFGAGFLALFLLWGIAAFVISYGNNHLLAQRMATLILKINSPGLLILVTGFIGATVAGFAALAGSYTRKIISPHTTTNTQQSIVS